MKVSDIVNAYCEANGLRVTSGRLGDDDPAPILAFLIMDCAQAEFMREIAPLPYRHERKRLRAQWCAAYHTFNQRLFSCLDADQRDYAIEMMDAYTEAVAYETMLIRVAVMDLVKDCEFEDQKNIASLMLCNVFSQVAQITWGLVFRNAYSHEERCPELDRMRNIAHKLTNGVALLPEDVDPNESPKLTSAVDRLQKKTVKWLNGYGKSQLQ